MELSIQRSVDPSLSSVKSTYGLMVTPNDGGELKLIPVLIVNGVNYIEIDKNDVQSEIDCRKSAVLCCVSGANPHTW